MTKIEKDKLNKKVEELKANEARFVELYKQIAELEEELGIELNIYSPKINAGMTMWDENDNRIAFNNILTDYISMENKEWKVWARNENKKGGNQ